MLWWLWESFRVMMDPLMLSILVLTLGYAIWKDFIKRRQTVELRHIALVLLVLPIAIMMRNGVINYHTYSNADINNLAMLLEIGLVFRLVTFMRKSRTLAVVFPAWMVFLAGNIHIYSSFSIAGMY